MKTAATTSKDISCIPFMRRRQTEKKNNLKVAEEQKRGAGQKSGRLKKFASRLIKSLSASKVLCYITD